MSGSGDEVPDINDRYVATFDVPGAGTLHLPNFLKMAVTIVTGGIIAWFAGAIRVINGFAELGADLILQALMPIEAILRRVWTSPTDALTDAWGIATASVGDGLFAYALAVLIVILVFWLITVIVSDVMAGGDEA